MLNTLILVLNISMLLFSSYLLARRFFYYCKTSAWICISFFQLFFIPYLLSAAMILSYYSVFILNSIFFLISVIFLRSKDKEIHLDKTENATHVILSILLWSNLFYFSYHIANATFTTTILPHIRKVYPFNGDVLAGSMPLLVDIIQSGSLWTAKSDYGHYLNGYELIQSWGIIFLRNESLFGVFHYLFAGILLFFSFKIFEFLILKVEKQAKSIIYLACQLLLFSCFFFPPFFPDWIFGPFGKTDLPSIGLTIMAIYFFLKTCLQEENYNQHFILAILASCLFTAIKPQALYYFLFLFSMLAWQHFKIRQKSLRLFILFLLPMVSSASLYVRFKLNMTPSYMAAGTESTLFSFFFTKDHTYLFSMFNNKRDVIQTILFDLNWSNGLFYTAWLISLLLLGALPFVAKSSRLLYGLFIGSFIGFLFAPLAIWYPCIQIRYSLAMMPLLFILIAYFSFYLISKLTDLLRLREFNTALPDSPWFAQWIAPAFAIFLVVGIGLQSKNWKTRHNLNDFPGNRDVVFNAGTYKWVFNHVQGKKIYFFLAQPYGLYGKGLTNQLFYDKNVVSNYPIYDPLRWVDGINQYHPDYFVYQTYSRKLNLNRSVSINDVLAKLKSKLGNRMKVVFANQEGIVVEIHDLVSAETTKKSPRKG